ncbi:MAG TPA: hypothetical protein VFV08_15890 [Puia sp.]|nr:hypothetical protein [Puia sp.]
MSKARRGSMIDFQVEEPIPAGETSIQESKKTLEFGESQLNKKVASSPTPGPMSKEMQAFVAKGGQQTIAINDKKPTKDYGSMPLAVKRTSLDEIAQLIDIIPLRGSRKRPGFSVQDYVRRAVDNQIKRDQKNNNKFLLDVSKAITYTVVSVPKSSTQKQVPE